MSMHNYYGLVFTGSLRVHFCTWSVGCPYGVRAAPLRWPRDRLKAHYGARTGKTFINENIFFTPYVYLAGTARTPYGARTNIMSPCGHRADTARRVSLKVFSNDHAWFYGILAVPLRTFSTQVVNSNSILKLRTAMFACSNGCLNVRTVPAR